MGQNEYCYQCGKESKPVVATGKDSEGEPACSGHAMAEAPSSFEIFDPGTCDCGKKKGHIGRHRKTGIVTAVAVDADNRVPEDALDSGTSGESRTGNMANKKEDHERWEQSLMERRLALVDALCEILRQLYACDEALRAMGLEIVEEEA